MSLKRVASITLAVLFSVTSACTKPEVKNPGLTAAASPQNQPADFDNELAHRLKAICDRADGIVALSVVHIESGKSISINGKSKLALYSVFKLPVAIAVLKEIEENRLKLDQKVHVTPSELVPGTPWNDALWQKPVYRTVAELIEFSIARSDNTSTDKLLQLVGGARAVDERIRSLGFQNLDIHSSTAEYLKTRANPNTGAADDLTQLLAQLHEGKILQSSQQNLLIGFMQRANTGLRRLRGDLPAGTLVADKTGSGEPDEATRAPKATNDVGLIRLPSGRGNLAIAVLVNNSRLNHASQEKLIADIARAAYDFFVVDRSNRRG